MENPGESNIFLFISKSSIYFQDTLEEFNKIIQVFGASQKVNAQIFDIDENPEVLQQYKVDALPTLLVQKHRIIGTPDVEEVMRLVGVDMSEFRRPR